MIEANTGHHAVESGLQNHSVGNCYPLAIVGYSTHPSPTLYTIENIKTGEVLVDMDDQPRSFLKPEVMLDALMLRKPMLQPPRWAKGRPRVHMSGMYLTF